MEQFVIFLALCYLSLHGGVTAEPSSGGQDTVDEHHDPFFSDFESPLERLERMHVDPIRSSMLPPLARMFQMFDPMVPPAPFSQFSNPALRGFQRSRLNALNSGLGNMAGFVSSMKTNPDGSVSHVGLQFSQLAYPCGDKICTNVTYVNSTSSPAVAKETTSTTEQIETSTVKDQEEDMETSNEQLEENQPKYGLLSPTNQDEENGGLVGNDNEHPDESIGVGNGKQRDAADSMNK